MLLSNHPAWTCILGNGPIKGKSDNAAQHNLKNLEDQTLKTRTSSNKLFVGGLSWNTDDNSLQAAFSAHGTVEEAKVIVNHKTGRSRGLGFVTMSQHSEATDAIAALDGQELDGRTVRSMRLRIVHVAMVTDNVVVVTLAGKRPHKL